jgi:hypothetical protein
VKKIRVTASRSPERLLLFLWLLILAVRANLWWVDSFCRNRIRQYEFLLVYGFKSEINWEKMNISAISEENLMHDQDQFLLKRELGRLLMDFNKCSNPIYKEQIREDIVFLRSVIANEITPFK